MYRRSLGFTLTEILVVFALVAITLSLAIPSWERATQKRRLTSAVEQVVAFLSTAQSEAQKRNRAVSMAFDRGGNQNWCLGTIERATACDCNETDSTAANYCSLDGVQTRIGSSDFESLNLLVASDNRPGGGDSYITFDPVRGILWPYGDHLHLLFESGNREFRLRVSVGPTGLLTICDPGEGTKVGGYSVCTT